MTRGLLFSLLAVMVLLGGCREEEQGRRLDNGKGSYAGASDERLDPEVVARLTERAEQQRF